MDDDEIGQRLQQALAMRAKYTPTDQRPSVDLPQKLEFSWNEGIIQVAEKGRNINLLPGPTLDAFYDDMEELFHIRTEGPVASHAYMRLTMMKSKFDIYTMLNHDAELEEQRLTPHRDFYNIRKVDTHIHHSAAMNCKHLLRFMKNKLKNHSSDVVIIEDGKNVTLKDVFNRLNIEPLDLSMDKLQMWTDRTCMFRFDRFNNLYSPMGQSLLRTVFLKTDNDMGGRYLAEITQELLDDLEDSKYLHTEWRLSIYGRNRSEWDKLARWVLGHSSEKPRKPLLSSKNRWMIQIPRLYSAFKQAGQIENFAEMLENIFTPMIEATLGIGDHEDLRIFLTHVSGFDTVDDESKNKSPVDRLFSSRERRPDTWDLRDNPSYKYYTFHIQTNLRILNRLRAARGLNQFQFRPHCGEAGEIHHLDASFLLADNIQHGVNLRKSPPLQYLYYLARIGLSVSPISNNQLFVPIGKSPFPQFFALGMLVTLSSDDPLMFHQTKEALMEEYSVAKQIWRLGTVDLCEIAHNSVLISGFPKEVKAEWLGITSQEGKQGDVSMSNVPSSRHLFRQEVFDEEWSFVHAIEVSSAKHSSPKAAFSMMLNSVEMDRAVPESDTSSTESVSYPPRTPSRITALRSDATGLAVSTSHEISALAARGKSKSAGYLASLTQEGAKVTDSPLEDTILPGELRRNFSADKDVVLTHRSASDAVARRRSTSGHELMPRAPIAVVAPWIIVGFLLGYMAARK
eukprot:GEMP01011143.1.p1 GENE.GEMP01011143.1~~GEMP01011143.1.p1  ORF type:complete len:753 (+),score=137.96 GEMP01011143.1:48-2261(+)